MKKYNIILKNGPKYDPDMTGFSNGRGQIKLGVGEGDEHVFMHMPYLCLIKATSINVYILISILLTSFTSGHRLNIIGKIDQKT